MNRKSLRNTMRGN